MSDAMQFPSEFQHVERAKERLASARRLDQLSHRAVWKTLANWSRSARSHRWPSRDLAGQVARDVERLSDNYQRAHEDIKRYEKELKEARASLARAKREERTRKRR